jgi:hypothetical protein
MRKYLLTLHTAYGTLKSAFTKSVDCVQSVTECTFEICYHFFEYADRHLCTIVELQTLRHKATSEVAEQEKCSHLPTFCTNIAARKVRTAELQ